VERRWWKNETGNEKNHGYRRRPAENPESRAKVYGRSCEDERKPGAGTNQESQYMDVAGRVIAGSREYRNGGIT